MKIREIRLGGGTATPLSIEPREGGATVVPIAPPLEAERLARAVREALGAPRREALRIEAPVIEIHLQRGAERALVQDDAARGRRSLVVRPARGEETVLTAETHALGDVYAVERLLLRVASLLGLETAADVLPALAHAGEPSEAQATPKELAYQRAFQEMRAIARQLEAIDRGLSERPPPVALRLALLVVGAGVGAATLSWLLPGLARGLIVATVLGLIAYLARLGRGTWKELRRREALPERARELRPALEAARERVAELAETLRRRGEDPDEVLERFLAHDRRLDAPSVLARESVSSAELLELEARGAQTIVLVPASGAAGDEFGGRVRRPQGFARSPSEPTVPGEE